MTTTDPGLHAERTALAHGRTSLACLTAGAGLAKLAPITPPGTKRWALLCAGAALPATAVALHLLVTAPAVPAPLRLAGVAVATSLAGAAAFLLI
ncbi:DUF202 domain-containing protein [Dactylosporangium aurantiacum]|uniref:DUF202 domain-containing protein n=1 Tax=Dactylosporangium aurantiacum TaxID=35754 RepID=A0A9Q9IB54_9ACTN|nr:DUF202 domain-containing protein [Dactylosporangium aurantiacum]MDG6107303.1 DUF202 domain-containing protein [Dactylosporangium aurantiacum]UWZ51170.1 DUF202 domain-containing protein [Dactylosporangium aurantiacum]